MAVARAALIWRPVPAAAWQGAAAIHRAAIVVGSTNLVVILADIFAFEVDIGVSPAAT